MSFEETIGLVQRWATATEALAALGAQAALEASGRTADPAVAQALQDVAAAAGIDLSELLPPQRALVANLAGMCVNQASDLLGDPARSPRWEFTDAAIVQGWGRGSGMVPGTLAQAPELADVTSLLDIGTGGGWLAVAATEVWPKATVVGIDVFSPSLDIARANVADAGLGDRITIREQDVLDLDDDAVYDCAWFPTFFFTDSVLDQALPKVFRAVKPGGWIVVARFAVPPDPIAEATIALRCVWAGGEQHSTDRLTSGLEGTGCTGVHVLGLPGPSPLQYVLGKRPG